MKWSHLILATFLSISLLGVIVWYAVKPLPFPHTSTPAAAAILHNENPLDPTFVAPVILESPIFQYIEVIDGCGPYWEGACVNMRSGPGTEHPIVSKLRTGIVLKVAEIVIVDGVGWYKIAFDEGVRYPERVTGDWYVAADYVRLFTDTGDQISYATVTIGNSKRITVDISEQMLYAYENDTLFMQEPISTGLEFTPTPRGTFIIFKKMPSRYMQGPVPDVSDDYYDLPGVPWDLYFTHGGAVIHGAYWHDHFGQPWSHGCVNLPPQKAKELYLWAEVGTPVTVQE